MLLYLSFAFWPLVSHGAELTDDAIRNAKTIAVYPGTFDPFTLGHEAVARKVMDENLADILIVAPNPTPVGKLPLPLDIRLKLMSFPLKNDPKIMYPAGEWLEPARETSELMARIRILNPTAEIKVVVGSDVANSKSTILNLLRKFSPDEIIQLARRSYPIKKYSLPVPMTILEEPKGIPISSTKVRDFFIQNKNLYVAPEIERDLLPNNFLNEQEAREIFARGIYIDQFDSKKVGIVGQVSGFFNRQAEELGVRNGIRKLLVALNSRPLLDSFLIDGKEIVIEKRLGSGLNGDTFVVLIADQRYVLKVTKPDAEKRTKVIYQDIPIHKFLGKNSTIPLAALKEVDPNGNWILSEFIEGESVEAAIKKNNGKIPSNLREGLLNIFNEAKRLRENGGFVLDISADNILVKANGDLVLVDTGPIRQDSWFTNDFSEMEKKWISASGFFSQSCPEIFMRILNLN